MKKKYFDNYIESDFVVFSCNITQKKTSNGWKKSIIFPKKWTDFTLENTYYNEKYNGMGILTGKVNGIFVLDIDNVEQWTELLKAENKKEPPTVKAMSGSGGIHYYFKYTEDLDIITSKDHAIEQYSIDVKTNGGCVILPPSSYYNNNLEKSVKYEWIFDIFEYELLTVPEWIKTLLMKKHVPRENKSLTVVSKKTKKNDNIESIIPDDERLVNYNNDDIEVLVNMLSEDRCDKYNEWLNVGMCLFNINSNYCDYWIKWSKKSKKYEIGSCENKWKSFASDAKQKKLSIGSLLYWCKTDNETEYVSFIKRKKINSLIVSKFPNDKLLLGDTVEISKNCSYTHLHNKECLIKGTCHKDLPNSMYIEMIKDLVTIKCKHLECFGKIYPCQHVQLTKQEMNIVLNGDIHININNGDNELIEFQQINIYDDEIINNLVFNSLNGESYTLAEIIYHYYGKIFNYGEDDNWYMYENHRWKNVGKKNVKLRYLLQPKLKELYSKLIAYYKQHDNDKKKIFAIKQIMKSFDNTSLKNNIMTELIDIYSENNNPNSNFTHKLDSDNYLVGFNNGIYDMRTYEFRNGTPEDYITLSVGYDYSDKYTEKFPELLKFLNDIQPNPEEYEYMMTFLSIGLIGNVLELFTILTGCGRNGKSKLVELLKCTFGNYFGAVQSQLFTRPRPDANSPDPGLLNLLRKRIVIASEPEKNSKLNSGFIKFITGRDSTSLRQCHQNDMIDFTANFITLLICNDIPECDDIDNAFSKRLRCINFPTEFVLDPVENNQKKIDVNINENFPYWKMDFMLLLIEYYKKYMQTKKLIPTENILKWTNQYKEDTDIYLQFLNECTEYSETHIHNITLYEHFKGWYKVNNPNTKIPNNKVFSSSIKKYKIVECVKIDGKTSTGIKNLQIVN
jgi:P4 family phage/plasmid primase-like protien